MRLVSALLATLIFATTPASAEVTAQADNGFAVSHVVSVSVDADAAFAMLRTPAKWWDKDHTWTGNSDNLYMDAQAGGCFCELIQNQASTESGAPQRTLRGSVQHMQILYVDPGNMLRLSGALGPLQGEAMVGTLTIRLAPIKGGTRLTFEYVAGGFMRMPQAQMAAAVDGVISAQASRLAMALGPLVGGDKLPALEPEAPMTTGADQEPIERAGQGSVSDLVVDLEPDAVVSDGQDDMEAAFQAADEAQAEAEAAAKAEAVARKPRTKPGTRPISTRATSTSPRAVKDEESGR